MTSLIARVDVEKHQVATATVELRQTARVDVEKHQEPTATVELRHTKAEPTQF